MKKVLTAVLITTVALSCTNKDNKMETYKWPDATPPVAEIKPTTRILHGDTVVDNYYWMIDYFKKGPDSAKVVDYLTAENKYLDTMMSGTKAFREDLFKEMEMRDDFDLKNYLMHKIDYPLTNDKKKALYLFLDYIKKL